MGDNCFAQNTKYFPYLQNNNKFSNYGILIKNKLFNLENIFEQKFNEVEITDLSKLICSFTGHWRVAGSVLDF